jgi:hypothetical protein
MPNFTTGWLRAIALALLLVSTLFLGGCSFNHEWKKAGANPAPPNGIEGRWQGFWVSGANGHTDSLRAVITRKDVDLYRARFHAKYHKVFSFGYTVLIRTEPSDQGLKFRGEANLGWWAGGVYHYEGHADDTNFFSTYSCKYDHGTFRMSRP